MIIWWTSLFLCFSLKPNVLLEINGAISFYATHAETVWIYRFGMLGSGVLMVLLANRTSKEFHTLKLTLLTIGMCGVLLPFFPVGASYFTLIIHLVLSAILFLSMGICVIGSSMSLKARGNTILSVAIAIAYLLNVVSFLSESSRLLNIPFDQACVVLILGVWLQINLRRNPSIATE